MELLKLESDVVKAFGDAHATRSLSRKVGFRVEASVE